MAFPTDPVSNFLQSATSNLLSLFTAQKSTSPSSSLTSPPRICLPLLLPFSNSPLDSGLPAIKGGVPSSPDSGFSSAFPSTVRVSGLNSNGRGGGPAFVGQVFSMCDLSGTGLMAVSTHFDIPFLSKRTPDWLKKIFATINKSERNGPVFRFFMDLGDAVAYVKRLNIPSGVVGACRLDLAYEHFKEKPHMFQFVPNEKQVKAANRLLKTIPQNGGSKKVDGVPVFSAQNLDIAIATTDGIKWYTPYFFDKNVLDNILEESVDQHFYSLIQTRHVQRRRDVIDDNLAAEAIEEMGDNLWEPPEVQELLDEMGNPGIPLSVISKAAEMQLLYAVDKVILGNRWLRKAAGIQPKFPYIVDSFEKRSAASVLRASESGSCLANSEMGKNDSKDYQHQGTSELTLRDNIQVNRDYNGWNHNWEAGQMTKASLKKTMEDLTKELEQTGQGHTGNATGSSSSSSINDFKSEDRDPLFVANVGDYYSGMAKTGSARWVRGRNI
ncbi:uncharacterized protein LOC121254741 [Juglans microcarpa x Juglans regia]|uniref:uncharacterized protein LOC121254741 n=1 Tax=Juglans microcarpa x Juglans regia TaxID=2249226 RepID=UPI001B7E60BB|nr:uncharacterized protein LOC121254741 [Juglans microcarpa x Juglans regia]